MTEVKKSYGEKLIDDAIANVRAEGKAEGITEDRLTISKAFGIPLEQLEELIRKSNLLES